MKYRENERGGALLMVLMLVVVFTILGIGLMSMNMSASKQFDKKEEQVQARHQAEMGILHYKAEVEKIVKGYNGAGVEGEKVEDYLKGFCESIYIEEINSPINVGIGTYMVDGMDNKPLICGSLSSDTTEITLKVKSIGRTSQGTSKTIEADITVSQNDGMDGENNGNGSIVAPPSIEENYSGKLIEINEIPESGLNTPDSYKINKEKGEVNNVDWKLGGSLLFTKSTDFNVNKNSISDIQIGKDFSLKISKIGHGMSNQTTISVGQNFTNDGSLTIGNGHDSNVKMQVGGNFTTKGTHEYGRNFGSDVEIVIGGNFTGTGSPLIGSGIEKKVCIVVHGDIEFPLVNVIGNSQLYVLGKSKTTWNGHVYNEGHKFGKQDLNCPVGGIPADPETSQPPTTEPEWIVMPNVNADYK